MISDHSEDDEINYDHLDGNESAPLKQDDTFIHFKINWSLSSANYRPVNIPRQGETTAILDSWKENRLSSPNIFPCKSENMHNFLIFYLQGNSAISHI